MTSCKRGRVRETCTNRINRIFWIEFLDRIFYMKMSADNIRSFRLITVQYADHEQVD
jgi:hypothetical protein